MKMDFCLLKFVLVLSLYIEVNCIEPPNEWERVIETTRDLSKTNASYGAKQSREQYNDAQCFSDVITFYNGINQSLKWAVKMYDSWGNFPSGILSGNVYNLGDFDECVTGNVSTQYCLVTIEISSRNSSGYSKMAYVKPEILHFMNVTKMLVGICYPSSCSPDLTSVLYQTYIDLDDFQVEIHSNGTQCYINEPNRLQFTSMQVLTICLFSLIAFLIVTSTIVELFVDIRETGILLQVWKAFSAYQNLPELCDTQAGRKDNEIKFACLDGLRAISIIWIAYGHSVANMQRSAVINTLDITSWTQDLWTIISWSTFNFAVDTFFVIGGFLAARSIKNQFEHDNRLFIKKFLSLPRMWFHRYIRLAPVVMSTVLFFTTIGVHLGKGPFWNSTMQEIELCYDSWWSAVLFVQNYASPGKMCLGHLWYLAVDMQMFIVTTILLFLIHWKGMRFLSVAILMVLGNVFNNMYWYFTKNYQWNTNLNRDERDKLTYYPTHARMSCWLIGVILAIIYLQYFKKQDKFKISWKLLLIGYIYCVAVLGLIIANISIMTNRLKESHVVQNAVFDSFSRILWGTVIAIIIFKCITKNGGPVNRFLSSPIWKPLAKLSFCIYVLHYVIQLLKIGRSRTTEYMDNFSLIERFWSDFGITVTVSVVWTLAFEIPFRIIERIKYNQPSVLPTVGQESYTNEGADKES